MRRPHFHLQDDALYFLISRRPYAHLGDEEQAVWKAIEGTVSVGHLRTKFAATVDKTVQRFIDLCLCEQVPADFPLNRRRVLVIEPHMDDAALSVGGTMWLRRNECEFTVLSAVGVSNYTSYFHLIREFFDVQVVSKLRKAESALVMRCLGGHHIALDQIDAPLRYQAGPWTLDWFVKHQPCINAHGCHPAGPVEHKVWATTIGDAIARLNPEEVWIPFGAGKHTDHELTRNACLHIMVSNPELLSRRTLKLYMDVPYAAAHPHHIPQLVKVLEEAGSRLEKELVEIGEVMPDKLRLLSIFDSQFKIERMQARVKTCAKLFGSSSPGFREVFYRVVTPPVREIWPLSCYAERDSVLKLADKLKSWYPRNRSASLIRILLPLGVGRWADDMKYLLRMFPMANFEMHVSHPFLAETESLISPRIMIRPVDPGIRSWFSDALRSITRPRPLVILPGRERERHARIFSLLAFGSDALVAPAMSHFILALRLVEKALAEQEKSDL